MTKILINPENANAEWVESIADIRALYPGSITRSELIQFIAEFTFAANEPGEAGYDPNYDMAQAISAAIALVENWDIAAPDEAEARRRALEAQELGAELTPRGVGVAEPIVRRDVMSRFPGFAGATPIARAGMAPYYQTQDALVNFFANLAPTAPASATDWSQAANPPTFEAYLSGLAGGQPTLTDLRTNVGNVQRILAEPYEALGGASARGIHYAFQEPWTQLAAAIQPGLRAIAPGLRGAYRRGAGQHQESWQAMNPEKRFLDFAQQAGYW